MLTRLPDYRWKNKHWRSSMYPVPGEFVAIPAVDWNCKEFKASETKHGKEN